MAEDVKKTVKLAAVVGYLITAVAIIALPMMLVSQQDRSHFFWHRLIWTEFLVLLVWGYVSRFFLFALPGGSKSRGLGGILPVTGTTIGFYAAISFILVVAFPDLSSKFHVSTQIVLFACLVVVNVFFQFARAGAIAGAEPIPQGLRTPQQLCVMIKANQECLFPVSAGQNSSADVRRLHDALKSLHETIECSLPHVGRIGASQDYHDFAARIERLCSDLESFRPDSAEAVVIKKLCDTTNELQSKASQVASLLKMSAV